MDPWLTTVLSWDLSEILHAGGDHVRAQASNDCCLGGCNGNIFYGGFRHPGQTFMTCILTDCLPATLSITVQHTLELCDRYAVGL